MTFLRIDFKFVRRVLICCPGTQHRLSQALVRGFLIEIVIRSNSVSRKRIFLKKIHFQRELNYLPCQTDGNFLTNGNRARSIRSNWQKLMVRLIGQVFSIIFIKKKINIIQQVLFWFQGKSQTKQIPNPKYSLMHRTYDLPSTMDHRTNHIIYKLYI